MSRRGQFRGRVRGRGFGPAKQYGQYEQSTVDDQFGYGYQQPPAPPQIRSHSQMRRDTQRHTKQAKARNDDLQKKEVDTTTQQMEMKHPHRENPSDSEVAIRLSEYVNDWISTERVNIAVTLNTDYEADMIAEHTKPLHYDVAMLQYSNENDRKLTSSAYVAYCHTNIAWRLLTTLPRSEEKYVQDLVIALKSEEPPENTPVWAEMLSHLGKSTNEHYGNIRIDGQLVEAKQQIIKAMLFVKDALPFSNEFIFKDNKTVADLTNYRDGFWRDPPSLDWIRRRAYRYFVDVLRKKCYQYNAGTHTDPKMFGFSMPFVDVKLTEKNKPWHTDAQLFKEFVERVNHQQYPKADIDEAVACLAILGLDYNTFHGDGNTKMNEIFTGLDGTYANATVNDIFRYIKWPRLDEVLGNRELLHAYGVIVSNYRAISEARIKMIYKLVPLSAKEFGTDALIMEGDKFGFGANPTVNSQFKLTNKGHVAAAAIFGFTRRIRFKIADTMVLRSPLKLIMTDAIKLFARKT